MRKYCPTHESPVVKECLPHYTATVIHLRMYVPPSTQYFSSSADLHYVQWQLYAMHFWQAGSAPTGKLSNHKPSDNTDHVCVCVCVQNALYCRVIVLG